MINNNTNTEYSADGTAMINHCINCDNNNNPNGCDEQICYYCEFNPDNSDNNEVERYITYKDIKPLSAYIKRYYDNTKDDYTNSGYKTDNFDSIVIADHKDENKQIDKIIDKYKETYKGTLQADNKADIYIESAIKTLLRNKSKKALLSACVCLFPNNEALNIPLDYILEYKYTAPKQEKRLKVELPKQHYINELNNLLSVLSALRSVKKNSLKNQRRINSTEAKIAILKNKISKIENIENSIDNLKFNFRLLFNSLDCDNTDFILSETNKIDIRINRLEKQKTALLSA